MKEQQDEEEEKEKEEGKEEEREEEEGGEKEEELSALEKILPTFPAARRQVFLQVGAVLGLIQPSAARGDALSARVFWNGDEVRKSALSPYDQGMRCLQQFVPYQK